jgi:(S)-mandelate dehydrogenase
MTLKRKLYSGNDFRRAFSIEELRTIARRRVPNFAFEYVEGGAEDEVTLGWNRAAFESIRLVPGSAASRARRSSSRRRGSMACCTAVATSRWRAPPRLAASRSR